MNQDRRYKILLIEDDAVDRMAFERFAKENDSLCTAEFAGSVAERVGAPRTVALGGLVCVAAAALFALRIPSIRAEARQLIVAQGLAGGDPPSEVTGTGENALGRKS